MNKPIEVDWPPILTWSRSGQRIAVSGGVWLPVPDATTFEDLPRYMVVKRRERPVDRGFQAWTVKGSKGNEYRVVERNGHWACSCPGYGFRRTCRHINEVKSK